LGDPGCRESLIRRRLLTKSADRRNSKAIKIGLALLLGTRCRGAEKCINYLLKVEVCGINATTGEIDLAYPGPLFGTEMKRD
jgi:hypothetical protein